MSRPDWLATEAAAGSVALLEDAGHAALFVGGCVRNTLLGAPVTDLDVATDALPERVLALAKAAGIKAVPTGIEHGTVTLVLGGVPVEVTTFRRDVATDGRHATVAFSDTVADDAARRDFTMNALYMDGRGQVVDPLGGLPDLHARHVRFVGDADRRVAEDYLRILRFFRFSALYGDPARGLDGGGLAACAAGADGLSRISAERIGAEMLKLCAAPDPAPALAAMAQAGILARVLPGGDDAALAPLVHLEDGSAPDPIRRLAVLSAAPLQEALRLSRAQARRHEAVAHAARDADPAEVLGHRLGAQQAIDALRVRAALLGQPLAPGALDAARAGAQAVFPVTAQDLMPGLQGAALGAALEHLRRIWLAGGLRADKASLLRHLQDGDPE